VSHTACQFDKGNIRAGLSGGSGHKSSLPRSFIDSIIHKHEKINGSLGIAVVSGEEEGGKTLKLCHTVMYT
jgi:hypothetical protein